MEKIPDVESFHKPAQPKLQIIFSRFLFVKNIDGEREALQYSDTNADFVSRRVFSAKSHGETRFLFKVSMRPSENASAFF
jgi:hypothetical protein